MKIPFALFFVFPLLFGVEHSFAQNEAAPHHVESKLVNHAPKSASEAESIVKETFSIFERGEFDLRLQTNVIASENGDHYRFMPCYNGIPIHGEYISLHSYQEMNTSRLSAQFSGSYTPVRTNFDKANDFAKTSQKVSQEILSKKDVWINSKEGLIPGVEVHLLENSMSFKVIYTSDAIYSIEETSVYHSQKTSATGQGFAFAPNPIVSTQQNYGYQAKLIDNDDQTNDLLDDQRINVTLDITLENGIYYLENDHVVISEHSFPDVDPAKSLDGNFFFDRSQSGFEDVNVLYHITEMKKYLNSLGYGTVMDYQVPADAHALNGADNSNFIPSTNPPRLNFGEGGVDDAEDGHVIIHEMGHGIMHSLAPNTNFGTERQAMDEAYGDYFASSYATDYGYYRWNDVYSWDGHNEYWDGRVVKSSLTYQDKVMDIYKDAPIWSSSLMQIWFNLGKSYTDQLALEAGYLFESNFTMVDGGEALMTADTVLSNGNNADYICHILLARGIFSSCPMPEPSGIIYDIPLAINQVDAQNGKTLFYPINLSSGNFAGRIETREEWSIQLYDINGRAIKKLNGTGYTTINTSLDFLNRGIYVGTIQTKDSKQSFKWMHQ